MKQLNPAPKAPFLLRLLLFSFLISIVSPAHAQCPAPTATADYYTLYNDRSNILGVTANDANPGGGTLTVTLRRAAAHGTASVTGVDITYLATAGYTGPDTVSYVVCNSCPTGSCDTGYVYLNIIACIVPQAVNDTTSLIQGASAAVDVSANDASVSSFGNVTVTLLNAAHFGSTVILSNRTVTYQASSTQTGIDTIAYRICTDCGCDTALAIFTITTAPCRKPTAFADNVYAGYSVTCSSSYNVTANDLLPVGGGGVATVTIVQQPGFGTATVVNNRIVYTCTDSTRINQTDLIRYSVCNSCFCDTGIVAVHISNYLCNGRNPNVNKDTAYVCRNYPVSINVTANDADPEGTVVTIDTIVGQGQHGIARKTTGNIITYTPAANYSGHDYFVYSACDGGTPKLCNIATVDVFVNDCNSPPVILNAANLAADTLHVAVYEDSFLTYCFHYTQADSPYVYIAHIGTSIDTITPTAGSTAPGTAPCVRIAVPYQSRQTQTVEFVICNAYPLCDTVQMIVSVIPINHHPVAVPDFLYYNTTGCGTIFPLVNDYDEDLGDIITVTSYDSISTHGGTVQYNAATAAFCYQPSSTFAGNDTFYYVICDSSRVCASSYVVVTVPIIARRDTGLTMQDQAVNIAVLTNDTRTSSEYLTLCSQAGHGTLALDSTGTYYTYTPDHNYPIDPVNPDTSGLSNGYGVDSFCYTLCSVSGRDTVCSNAEVVVLVGSKKVFYIPQGISPNGDGVNDKFMIEAVEELPKSQLLVFNRYGDEVWRNETEGYQNDFDGTWKKNGQPLPDMSYWYIFKFNDGVHADRMGYIIIER